MKHLNRLTVAGICSLGLAFALAACGGSDNSSTSSNSAAAATTVAGGGTTVATKSIGSVGTVLVDSKGNVLYTNNMDSGSKVACTGSCTSIWPPLTSSGQPTSGDSAVQAKLGVVKTAGGSQVTYGGKPLYTFVQDSPGQATGNGVTDNFGGTSFTWTAATVSGQAASGGGAAATTTSGSSSSGGSSGGGGYGY